MAKVTITIEDEGMNQVTVRLESDPGFPTKSDEALTLAQGLAAKAMKYMHESAEEEVEEIEE